MKFRQLRYFLILAEELHFGRAAERLAISQPPLSWNIRQLEDAVGARLFERSSRDVRLTPAGRAFVPAARALLAQADEAARLAREVEQGIAGVLKVGFVSSMLYRGLPELLREFAARLPRIQVRTSELNSGDQIVALAHGQIDVGFVHTLQLPPEIEHLTYSTEPFVCCLPATHALARSRKIKPERLRDDAFVMFSRAASPDYYERVLTLCTSAGFYPDVRHEARHWLSVVSLVAQGLGVALVPRALAGSRLPGAAFVALDGATVPSQTLCVWRSDNDSAALQGFLAAVRGAVSAVG